MLQVDNEKLFARLSRLSRQALANATGLCVVRTNYSVELEHWLITLADAQSSNGAGAITPLRTTDITKSVLPSPCSQVASVRSGPIPFTPFAFMPWQPAQMPPATLP